METATALPVEKPSLKFQDGMVLLAFIVLSSAPGPILMRIKRRNKEFHTPKSYFLGNRDLPVIATAISLFMSFSPLVLITDFPVEIYHRGATPFLRCLGQSVAVIISASLFVPMLFNLKVETTYEYVERRYNTRSLRLTSSAVAIVISLINNALVTYALCQSLVVVTPLPIWAAAILVSMKATFSAGAGGIQSVVWTNVIHFMSMFACLTAVVVMSFKHYSGGFGEAWQIAADGGRINFLGHSIDPRDDFTLWTAIFPAIFQNIGLLFSQVALSRYTSFPKLRRCVFAVLSIIPQTIALHVLLFFLAISMYASYSIQGCDPVGLDRKYTSGLSSHFIKDYLEDAYPGIVGAWMVTLMASTLSTLSAAVNATVGLVWHDFMGDFFEQALKEKKLQFALKMITIALGTITLIMALVMWRLPPGYVKLIGKTTLIVSSAFYLLHIAGALIPFVNRPGVISAIIISALFTSGFSLAQFKFGFVVKQPHLEVPRHNCAAIIANMSSQMTTPYCENLTTSAVRDGAPVTSPIYFWPTEESTTAAQTITLFSPEPTVKAVPAERRLNVSGDEKLDDEYLLDNVEPKVDFENLDVEGSGEPGGEVREKRAVDQSASFTYLDVPVDVNQTHPYSNPAGDHLPLWLQFILSISFFFLPPFAIVFGLILAIFISLCTCGVRSAKHVDQETLTITNCFAEIDDLKANDAELWLLSPDSARTAAQQQREETDKRVNRRVFQSVNDYARSVDPNTPATMLEEASQTKKGSQSNLLQAQAPAVSIYGHNRKEGAGAGTGTSGATATTRFGPPGASGPTSAQNATYQQLSYIQSTHHAPEYFVEDERAASTFQQAR